MRYRSLLRRAALWFAVVASLGVIAHACPCAAPFYAFGGYMPLKAWVGMLALGVACIILVHATGSKAAGLLGGISLGLAFGFVLPMWVGFKGSLLLFDLAHGVWPWWGDFIFLSMATVGGIFSLWLESAMARDREEHAPDAR